MKRSMTAHNVRVQEKKESSEHDGRGPQMTAQYDNRSVDEISRKQTMHIDINDPQIHSTDGSDNYESIEAFKHAGLETREDANEYPKTQRVETVAFDRINVPGDAE